MINARPEDLTLIALQTEAGRLGIPFAGLSKDLLVEAFKAHSAASGASAPIQTSPSQPAISSSSRLPAGNVDDRWSRRMSAASVVIASLALIATAVQSWGVVKQVGTSVEEIKSKEQKDKILLWQQIVVFGIIDRSSGPHKNPGTIFEEIRQKYSTEAASVKEVDLTKEDLQPAALQKILLQLSVAGLVEVTTPDSKYVSHRTAINPRFDRAHIEEQAKYELFSILMLEPGKWKIPQLGAMLIDRTKLLPEEFNRMINEMAASGYIISDNDFKIWCAAVPPPPCPTRPMTPKGGIQELKGRQFEIDPGQAIVPAQMPSRRGDWLTFLLEAGQ